MRIRGNRRAIADIATGGLLSTSLIGLVVLALHGLPSVSAESVMPVSLGVSTVLSITTSPEDSLSIPLIPTASGPYSSRSVFVEVATNNATGFTMTFSAGETGTDLINSANNETNLLPPTSGSVSSPTYINLNTWGFAVPKTQANNSGLIPNVTNGFDNTYTEVSSVSTLNENYATLPVYASPLTLKETESPSNSDTTALYVGARMDLNKPSGSYKGTVVFSAIGNYVSPEPTGPCYNGERDSPCQVDIDENLIPVKYTGTSESPEWSTANLNMAGDWYDYGIQKWANAVAVTSSTLEEYKNAPANTAIPEEDILAYYVYIPRYAYEVQRSNPANYAACGDGSYSDGTCSNTAAREFNILFQKASDAKLTPFGVNGDGSGQCEAFIGPYAECAGSNNKYWTHPTFSFGNDCGIKPDGTIGSNSSCTELNGIWVGKFETSKQSIATTENLYNGSGPDEDPIIKPTVFSRRYMRIGYMFQTAQNAIGYHSLNAVTTNSRIAKPSDWGAISYLSTSSFGRSDSESGIEVWINNCYSVIGDASYVTGISGSSVNETQNYYLAPCSSITTLSAIPTEGMYFGSIGVHASTTDNVYGVYDMSGGVNEVVLGNFSDGATGNIGTTSSGMTAGGNGNYFLGVENKYLNVYLSTQFTNGGTGTNFQQCTLNSCGGHALFEALRNYSSLSTALAWNGDYASVLTGGQYSWVRRGGQYSSTSSAGLFNSNSSNGAADYTNGYRLIVSRY